MEAIGTLAGGIAHDFNNILTALVGYAAILKMKLNNENLGNYVDQILSASKKATDLIQSLLAFSRKQVISLKSVRINDILRGTEKLLKRLVTEDIAILTCLAAEDITSWLIQARSTRSSSIWPAMPEMRCHRAGLLRYRQKQWNWTRSSDLPTGMVNPVDMLFYPYPIRVRVWIR